MNELNQNGYLLIKNCISVDRLNYAKSCVNTKVHYKNLESYINHDMLGKVKKHLRLNVECTKYRVSNNNNSSDAGSFHRDLQSYNNMVPPVFTCLSYLDETVMELIPGSHLKPQMSLLESSIFFSKKKQIHVKPGDLLIFYATMLHRGIFYKTKNNERRLIQLFDCIEKKHFSTFKNRILHIPCKQKCNSNVSVFLITINKIPFLSELLNYVGFYTAAKGYGAYYNCLKSLTNDKDIQHLSTESNRNRLIPKGGFEDQNLYVVRVPNIKDISTDKYDTYLTYTFLLDIIFLFFAILTIVLTMIIALHFR